ncbi:MAG: tail fiber domain-containing protein, partial [Candidatus Udaeobacter sp.]
TASGGQALLSNTSGSNNTGNGFQALVSNTTGNNNTANGAVALFSNTTGIGNTATGEGALFSNTTGNGNTATGEGALYSNTTGGGNIALGFNAGFNLTTGSNNIDIGNLGAAAESNTIRIGTQGTQAFTIIAGIVNDTQSFGTPVLVTTEGYLGVQGSSARFKKDIATMEKASEAILALRPVTFHYKSDATGTPQFGLIAEEVAKVNPALVLPDKEGKPYTVRYDAVNAMLLNEFLKEHHTAQEQQATITQLESTVAQQQKGLQTVTARLEQQATQIQKVSAQLEASKRAPQVVNNP